MMRLGIFIKPFTKGLTAFVVIGFLYAQDTPLSEIFFLDLGIVIEPAKGSEAYSRFIEKPSKEVSFKIKKVESGSVYMASSKELLSTLGRINNRIERLESAFKSEVSSLRRENGQLRQSLAELKQVKTLPVQPEIVSKPPIKKTELSTKTAAYTPSIKPISKPEPVLPVFNQATYMAGVFAYQREDYQTALDKFSTLHLKGVSQKTIENILYWTADSYQQTEQYEKALNLLNKITVTGELRIDDALVKKGLLYRKMGNESLAIIAFSNVVTQHPDSEYFRLAKMELKKTDEIQ
ncbi:MAG: tetratricopeptide repeat protein [Candidatus Marinimicrobia bacterium]|nr:tetratricopeptide repeat protein [Candidatus Neomarinimicrobiota bacterium]MBL7030949.1 tetratricopeptide repeat protein [Candidatus Neomarinimicrobiota bacterium]